MILFIHILKTAGTTFDTIITRQYGRENIIDLNDVKIDMEFNNDNQDVKLFSELRSKENAQAVIGHFRYGLHKKLTDEPFNYIAFFRNPVDQFLSQYYYITNLDEFPDVKRMSLKRGNLEEFMESDLLQYAQNTQTYFLTEAKDRATFHSDIENMSHTALTNMRKSFLFCGITEKFDESIVIIKELLHWRKSLYYIRKKVNISKPAIIKHSKETIAGIEELNKTDIIIYNQALQIFNEQKSKIKYLAFKVFKFKILNFLYQFFRR